MESLPDKTFLGTSYAFSRKFNTRNLEHYWYPLWAQTLSDLVAKAPKLIVAPQFPIWFVDNHASQESLDEGDDPEDIVETAQKKQDDLGTIEVENGAVNSSFLSKSTVPEKDAKEVVVDFAIIHLTPQKDDEEWKIAEASVELLVEVKRSVSRGVEGDNLEAKVLEQLTKAQNDLKKQAAHLFLSDTNKQSIQTISAAGPYWSGTIIKRADVQFTMQDLSADYEPGQGLSDTLLYWTIPVCIGSPESDACLDIIFNEFKE
ncbi:uncharacterized protein F5891DRAFT_1210963 [Suillus fuscotomentosus]|uniref:Uncharacterized protein n=1 Tax=Suillus fuscotomentosus TaxID=1912939 RepID=A0AAD4HDY1_9AGAM|nr:uncharacterized protein F5891DRAFT_1210963 [Suillus fuscotomentosus]KAG1891731.1 hypothetical protein F5891DRAFT_1210963 [Suillus fuscotomentosus]